MLLLAATRGSHSGREATSSGSGASGLGSPRHPISLELTWWIGPGKFLKVAPQSVSQGPGSVCV